MTAAKVGDLVEVVWDDAVCDNDEARLHELSDLPRVTTRGILLARTERYVRVAGETIEHGSGNITYRAVTTIPAPWVIKPAGK